MRKTSIGPAGKYRHLLDLGSGGMAKVWLALRSGPSGFRKLMVVKELREHIAEQPSFRDMFLEEARLAMRLHHPNIVQTLEVGEDHQRYFLVMEHLDGQSLQAVLERKRLPIPLALSVLCAALAGLDAAHEWRDFDETALSVVHRDVSPQNILLTYDGQVKVVDFGIARTVLSGPDFAQLGTFRGKLAYVAPEQAAGEKVDRRADLFAAGVVLFELLTGHRMWGDLSNVAILHRLDAGQIPSPRSLAPVPPELEQICMRALAPDRSARYATAAELRDELQAYQIGAGQPTGLAELGPYLQKLFAEDRRRTRELVQRRIAEAASVPAMPAVKVPLPRSPALPTPPAPPHPAVAKSPPKAVSPPRTGPPFSPLPPALGRSEPPASFVEEPETLPQMPRPSALIVDAVDANAEGVDADGVDAAVAASRLPAPYRSVRLLHRTERGELHEAVHVGLERRVIVKLLPDVVDEAELLRQARALASLSHPCASRVLDAGMRGEGGAGAFVVREYVDGTPLGELLAAKGRLGAALTIRLGAQLLAALACAHERGLVHGQLGPEHLLVRSDLDRERLVVIDFVGVEGGPIQVRPGRQPRAPELARGEPPTASSDLFDAGVELYRCLAGAPPGGGKEDEAPSFAGAPAFELEPVRAFFVRALASAPEARFESASEMQRALLALPIAELARRDDEPGAAAVDPLAEPWLAPFTRSVTAMHTGLRARMHVTRADKMPTLWVLSGDPAIRGKEVGEALDALRQEMVVVMLDEAERAKALEALDAGRVDLPWIVLFGDLHVLLGEPLLVKLGACRDISRVLVSTHVNVELLQSTVNACGLDQQVCMPFEPRVLIGALRAMAKRSAALLRHYDRLRQRVRDAREQASALNRSIATVPHPERSYSEVVPR